MQAPKFYLFDLGVQRSLERTLRQAIVPGTFAFGRAFEHFVIAEMVRLNDALKLDCRFSHLRTKDGVEIDLIVERPGEPPALVEIKSAPRTTAHDARHLKPVRPMAPRSGDSRILAAGPLTSRVHCRGSGPRNALPQRSSQITIR